MSTRTYTKTKRAEQESETRQRITEAALALHSEVGPARTTISQIAERAGVQRHTVYAHFTDEPDILMACSGLHLERDAPPSPAMWEPVTDPEERLSKALGALYAWFGRNEQLFANVMRDAEISAAVRDISSLRFGEPIGAIAQSVSAGLTTKGKATLQLAMSFHTWRTLTRDAGMKPGAAVELMVDAVLGR